MVENTVRTVKVNKSSKDTGQTELALAITLCKGKPQILVRLCVVYHYKHIVIIYTVIIKINSICLKAIIYNVLNPPRPLDV